MTQQSSGEAADIAGRESRIGPGLVAHWLRRLLALGATGLLIASLLPLLHPLWPLASIAEHFALQILLGAALLSPLALALRRWVWLSVILGIALVQAWIIHPYWPLPGLVMTPAAEERRLKIVSLNVWVRGESYEDVRDYLIASGADVIGLVEVTPRWKAELASLRELYPHSVDCIGKDRRCEEMLLSKHPFKTSGVTRIDGGLPIVVWGEMSPDGYEPFTVAVTHLVWPLMATRPNPAHDSFQYHERTDRLPRLEQAEQVLALEAAIGGFGGDLILMGDFNAAPWSRAQHYLRSQTALDNQGFLAASWPSWAPSWARLPIDHVIVRGNLRLLGHEAGPDVGSDHLPVEAVVSLAP